MLDTLNFRRRLGTLQRTRDHVASAYAMQALTARQAHDWDAAQSAEQGAAWECQLIDEEIGSLTTGRLVRQAQRYLLPLPADDETRWEIGHQTGQRFLTPKGIVELRATVREEQRQGRSQVLAWLAGVTGLVGTVSGLVALFVR